MREQYFRKLLREAPYLPLRVHVSSGAHYDIPHPDFAQVDPEALRLSIPEHPDEKVKIVHCSWLHVSHVEQLM